MSGAVVKPWATEPLPKRMALGAYDRALRGTIALSPHLALRIADTAARALCTVGRPLARPSEVRGLRTGSGETPQALSRSISRTAAKNRVATAIVRTGGYDLLARRVQSSQSDWLVDQHTSERPWVLVMLHSGPLIGIHALLHHHGVPATVLTLQNHNDKPTPLELQYGFGSTAEDRDGSRARAFVASYRRLQGGGMVLIALDGLGKDKRAVGALGRKLRVDRGPASLAVLTGAPLVPVTAEWTIDDQIEVGFGDPIAVDEFPKNDFPEEGQREDAITERLGAWFGDYLSNQPGQIQLDLLRRLLLGAPAPRSED